VILLLPSLVLDFGLHQGWIGRHGRHALIFKTHSIPSLLPDLGLTAPPLISSNGRPRFAVAGETRIGPGKNGNVISIFGVLSVRNVNARERGNARGKGKGRDRGKKMKWILPAFHGARVGRRCSLPLRIGSSSGGSVRMRGPVLGCKVFGSGGEKISNGSSLLGIPCALIISLVVRLRYEETQET
jgi:hypothetical protein